MNKVTVKTLDDFKQQQKKFACVTAYDASFAALVAQAEIETLLIGDSLGNVIQGQQTTVPVTLEDMVYHIACVANGLQNQAFQPLLIADMPYMSYAYPEQAIASATELMQAGAQMIKMEGGDWLLDTVELMSERGINVCAHLGLTPQSVDALGGFRVQGKDQAQAASIISSAKALAEAGARLLVLECVPSTLAAEITQAVSIPVIGIGAGNQTDAQVLVMYDMLGMNLGKAPRFVKDYLTGNDYGIVGALKAYKSEVINGSFPTEQHSY
jgi:3-methyl-2-oxobutanoate hydroxymethyltransferase